MSEARQDGFRSEQLVDELLPESLDWRRLVLTYPLPALGVAAASGFWLGLKHGSAVIAALTAFAGQRASQAIQEMVQEQDLDTP